VVLVGERARALLRHDFGGLRVGVDPDRGEARAEPLFHLRAHARVEQLAGGLELLVRALGSIGTGRRATTAVLSSAGARRVLASGSEPLRQRRLAWRGVAGTAGCLAGDGTGAWSRVLRLPHDVPRFLL
jgi:hypothetical protein